MSESLCAGSSVICGVAHSETVFTLKGLAGLL